MTAFSTSRRGFMQLGATSAALLTLGASFASLTGCSKTPPLAGFQALRAGDIEFLSAIAPVILSGSYSGSKAEQKQLMQALDRLIITLQDYAQSQLMMLLDVVQSAPLRLAMDAQWADWSQASAADVDGFLQGMRYSRIPLKRMGYGSLCKLLCMSWYSQPSTFASTGYPGMPKKLNLPSQA